MVALRTRHLTQLTAARVTVRLAPSRFHRDEGRHRRGLEHRPLSVPLDSWTSCALVCAVLENKSQLGTKPETEPRGPDLVF